MYRTAGTAVPQADKTQLDRLVTLNTRLVALVANHDAVRTAASTAAVLLRRRGLLLFLGAVWVVCVGFFV